MNRLQLGELLLLAALWGGSFLFMRVATPEFGPIALIVIRTGVAAVFLLPLVLGSGQWRLSKLLPFHLLIAGVIGTAIPFTLFSYATLHVSAGYASIINSTATLFTALVAWLWLHDRFTWMQAAGMLAGILGVTLLALDRQGVEANLQLMAVLAGLLATFCYGIAANFTRVYLLDLPPLVIALGSQIGATLALLPFSLAYWPQQSPGIQAWVAAILLGIACTGVAYILYFRLIRAVGVHRTMTVTYLIPLFGVIWGMLFLDESLSHWMVMGGLLILLGVALSTSVFASFFRGKK